MSHNFILTDCSNLFYRQVKMCNPALGIDTAIGMSLHMILYSLKKEFNKHKGTHTVFFLEGRSWRKDVYPDYKANRKLTFAQMSVREQEDFAVLQESFDEFIDYISNKTNITVLQNSACEADDMIAIFVDNHPNDNHVLISSDSDFFQLLRYPNFTLYDPVKDILIKQDGIYNDKGERLEFTVTSTAKIKVGKPNKNFVCEANWYEYALFLKCVRGDLTDNIFSAYPGAREKGSTKTIGIREAYEDLDKKGYNYNNFMLQKWIDHNEVEHKVKDKYEFNRKLIDLREIPEDIKKESLKIITEEVNRKDVPAVEIGHHFMKYCGKQDLKKIGDYATDFMPLLKSKYGSSE